MKLEQQTDSGSDDSSCSPSSCTPETDKKATSITGYYTCETVPASFARKLELERNAVIRVASLMRDAMRCRPEIWNYAIDYYETIFPEKECPHDMGHDMNGAGMWICLGCRADITPENAQSDAPP